MEIILTINLDEVSSSIEDSLHFLNSMNMSVCELRMIDGKNFSHLNSVECSALQNKLMRHDVRPISIASPLFKWYRFDTDAEIDHDNFGINPRLSNEEKISLIDNTFANAHLLSVKYLRIFSELGEENVNSVYDFLNNPLFEYTLKKAINEDIVLLLENEPVCQINSISFLLKFAAATSTYSENLGIWLDVANIYEIGEIVDRDTLTQLSYRLRYLHIKDFNRKNSSICYVPVGEGDIDYLSFFKSLGEIYGVDKTKPLLMSVETHAPQSCLKLPYSLKSITTLRKLIREI